MAVVIDGRISADKKVVTIVFFPHSMNILV